MKKDKQKRLQDLGVNPDYMMKDRWKKDAKKIVISTPRAGTSAYQSLMQRGVLQGLGVSAGAMLTEGVKRGSTFPRVRPNNSGAIYIDEMSDPSLYALRFATSSHENHEIMVSGEVLSGWARGVVSKHGKMPLTAKSVTPITAEKPTQHMRTLATHIVELLEKVQTSYDVNKRLVREASTLNQNLDLQKKRAEDAASRVQTMVTLRSKITDEERTIPLTTYIQQFNDGEYDTDVVEIINTKQEFKGDLVERVARAVRTITPGDENDDDNWWG